MYVHVHVLYMVCTCTTCTGIIISTSIIITSISTNIRTVWTCTCNLYSTCMYSTSTCINLQSIKQMFRYGCIYKQKCTLYVGWPTKNGHQYISIDIMFDTFINCFTKFWFSK